MKRSLLGFARLVTRSEVRTLVRDRRAFFLAVLLPMLAFPLGMGGMEWLESSSAASLSESDVVAAYDLSALPDALAASIVAELGADELRLTLEPIELPHPSAADDAATRSAARATLTGERRLVLLADATAERPRVVLYFDGAETLGNEGARRVGAALTSLIDAARAVEITARVGVDPAAAFALDVRDVAPPENSFGHRLGKLLPLVLVLMMISAGSFAALGAFAGEREEGTIETLLVQPVPALALALGKLLTVLATVVVAAVGNALSFAAVTAFGMGASADAALSSGWSASTGIWVGRLALALVAFAPTAVLLSAALSLVSARARSFREGQHYILPLVLIGTLLAAPATQDRVSLSYLLALLPVTGPTLALRDTLAGSIAVGPLVVAVLSSLAWSFAALRGLAATLDAERLFRTRATGAELGARGVQSRTAIGFGILSVAMILLVGGRLQSMDLIGGLVVTLWGLVPLLAWLSARGTARRAGEGVRETLGLRRPRGLHLVGALCIAPALAMLVAALLRWQTAHFPMPTDAGGLVELQRQLEALPVWALVLLVGISPGITEELLFRGALLSGMRRDLSPVKVVLWQALLFAAAHGSVHRALPTALLGALFALVTLRTRSLFPAVVLHAVYNSIVVLELQDAAWLTSYGHAGPVGLGVLGVVCLGARARAD